MDPVFPDAANFKCHDNGEMERVGTIYYSQEEADELVLSAHRLGMQVIIHCLGPWAIEQALNSFERALQGETGIRPSVPDRALYDAYAGTDREGQAPGRDSVRAAAVYLHMG